MDQMRMYQFIAGLVVILTAMPVHECAHGFMADRLGDPTPRLQKRLTLNPLRHIDPLGALLILFAGFGWAKPVLVDSRNFRSPRRDMALVAIAGPLSNIVVAFVTIIIRKLVFHTLPHGMGVVFALNVLHYMIIINLYLAVFNLLPIPPLDGSKFFGALMPDEIYFKIMRYDRFIVGLLFLLVFTGMLTPYLQSVSGFLYSLINTLTLPIDLFFFMRAR